MLTTMAMARVGKIYKNYMVDLQAKNEKLKNRATRLIALSANITLQEAKKMQSDNEKIVCMLHYPPFNLSHDDNEVTAMLEKYGVNSVVFGHLHGYNNMETYIEKNGIKYYLTSCDIVNNNLISIID